MEYNKVLIVDDEATSRTVLKGLLSGEGLYLIFACDGFEALEKAAQFTPDVILLDVMMPDMDGFEVCRRLRADRILAEVPIIMVTALDDRDSRLQGIEAGADDFISKPFDRVELRARVKTIIRLNRYRHLLTERNKFEWMAEKANVGYLTLGEDDRIHYANPQACLWLGISANTANSNPETFLTVAKRQYRCEPQEMWLTWPEPPPIYTGYSLRYLICPETATADTLWLQVEQFRMEAGADECYLLCLHDVTALMKKQSVMWSFHSQVSHKLRTPSSLLTGFLEMAEENVSTLAPAELRSFLAIARQNAAQLQAQIQAIFQYVEIPEMVKLSRGRCHLEQIATIVNQTRAGLELPPVNIITHHFETPESVCVVLAEQALELILWELFENAKKFHPQHKPAIVIELNPHPDGIQIQVADDGGTLSPEQLAKVWMPYYQAERYFTGQLPGMGLGLSKVATLVWRVGGTCRIYNKEAAPGVVVELVLPLADKTMTDDSFIEAA